MDGWRHEAGGWILGEMVAGPATTPPLIGRGEDLAALEAALEQARSGEPVVMLLAGEAGIGKTRLVAEFSERAFAHGARVLTGACVDLGNADLPYGAIMNALRDVPLDAFERLAPRLRRELAALVVEAAPDGEAFEGTQSGLFGAMLRLLEQLGRDEPLLLVVEDVHWADRSTQELLKFLARGLRQAAALLVLTFRSDELGRDDPIHRFLVELQRTPSARSLVLAPLSRADTSRQLAALTGEELDGGTVDAVFARSEGNPFFTEELLAARAGGESIPASLRDAVLTRVDRLPSTAQRVARVAAAVGRRADHELLAALAELPEPALDEALRACVAGHVLVVENDGRGFRFRHALLQEVAASELLPGERQRLHARIADALESLPRPPGAAGAQQLAEIAHHRLGAHDPRAALPAALRAARAAEEVHALAEAARNYDAILELWDALEDPEYLTGIDLPLVLERAAECRWAGAGDAVGPVRLLERAIDELGPDASPLRRADYLSRLAWFYWDAYASTSAALPLHEQAIALLDHEPSETAARVRARYANTLLLGGDLEAAEHHAAAAVATARAVAARHEEADGLVTQFTCCALRGEAEAFALLEQARPLVLDTFDARIVKRFFTNGVLALHCYARYDEALAFAQEGIDVHARAGISHHGKMCMFANAADLLCALGRPDEARELLGDNRGAFLSDVMGVSLSQARIDLLRGDLEASAERLSELRGIPDQEPQVLVPCCTLQAEVALWRGELETALDSVGAAESRLTATDQLLAGELLATALRAQADGVELGAIDPAAARAEADRLVAELRRVTSGDEPTLPEAEARVLVGLAERGRLEGAADATLWAAAATGWEALGRPYEAAYARWRQGEAIGRAHGSRDELARVLAAAHAAARGVGSLHLADAIERLARRTRVVLPGVAAATAAPFPDLTAREREVLALVANGRTNRQIAETLFITDKTASVHVSNILGKLGAANRGEAAALAHRAGFDLEPSTYA